MEVRPSDLKLLVGDRAYSDCNHRGQWVRGDGGRLF